MKQLALWIVLVATGISILPVANAGMSAGKVPHVALYVLDATYCNFPEFREGLSALGYVEGRNIAIDCYHANGRIEELSNVAREVVRMKPDVIVARTHPVAEVVIKETRDIPVVTVASGDPVAAGWVSSLARPGGNVTGLTYFAWELYAKRLEYLKTAIPDLKRVAVLVHRNASHRLTEIYLHACQTPARKLGLKLVVFEANDKAEIEHAFKVMNKEKIRAVNVLGYLLYGEEAQLIADLARFNNIATMHFLHGFPSAGGLMGYGPDYPEMHRRMARYVDKILKGAKPGELPVEQPTRLIFSINLVIARELGIQVPKTLLLRADKVIE